MKKLSIIRLIGLVAVLVTTPAMADDTEIFFGVPAAADAVPPMVMLSLDWRSNLASPQCTFDSDPAISDCDDLDKLGPDIYAAIVAENKLVDGDDVSLFDALRGVLRVVFDEIDTEGFQIGFMMSHQNENNCTSTDGSLGDDKGCSDGGYILRGFDVVDESAEGEASKEELLNILKNVPLPDASPGSGHSYQGRELFYEFYRYLIGGDILNGHKGWSDFNSKRSSGKGLYNLDRDYTANDCAFGTDRGCEDLSLTFPNTRNLDQDDNVISPWVVWDEDIEDPVPGQHKYLSPYVDGDYTCSKTYTINFLFQVSNQDSDWNTQISRDIGNGTNEQGLELANTSGDNAFPEIIAKLYSHDHADSSVGVNVAGNQNVTSYFIVDKVNTKTTAYAVAGGTTAPYSSSENPQQLLEDILDIFRDIASVSTTFTAASVPVNVQNRTESLPDMYLAIFKVDEQGKPFWPGNVKKLTIDTQLQPDGSTLTLINDANGVRAFNASTGRISDDALTFWTDPAADDVVNITSGTTEISGRDGSSITRGGSGQILPGYRETSGSAKTISPSDANGTWATGESDGRQLFINSSSFVSTAAAGNALIPLNANSSVVGSLAEDAEIQKLLAVLIDDGTATNTYITDTAFVAEIETLAGASFSTDEAIARAEAAQILLKWVRGVDVFDWDADGDTDDARPWMMGDPLHSRPLTINYGTVGSYTNPDHPDIRILFGTNDGFFHSIRNTTSGGGESGVEEWAFMPRELLANVKELISQNYVGENKPYGVDLPAVSFVIDNDKDGVIERGPGGNSSSCTAGGVELDDTNDIAELECDKAYVYVGLRRGGKSYYALDVSAPEDEPRLLWQIINDGNNTDFTELGLSFSTPRLAWVRFEDDSINMFNGGSGLENVPVPVLIFGGGLYGGWDGATRVGRDDLNYDVATDSPAGHDPVGAALFMVHARTGQLIWKAVYGNSTGGVSNNEYHHDGLINSIPAAVTPVDSDGNGITDRLYVGDTGGVVWRFELPEYNPSYSGSDASYDSSFRQTYWRATKLAELGGAVGSVDDRRFYHGLSVVKSRDSIGAYDGIAIGSGDRTHPQSAPSDIENGFFMMKDRIIYADADPSDNAGVDGRTPYVIGDLFDVTDTCLNDSNNDSDSSNDCSASQLTNGWKLALEATGEKNLSIPLISGGNINFTTYLPEGGQADGVCAPNIGISRLYQVAIRDGSPDIHLHSHLEGDTLNKTDRYLDLASGIDGGVTAISPEVGLAGAQQTKIGDQRPNTFYWRELNVDVLDDKP